MGSFFSKTTTVNVTLSPQPGKTAVNVQVPRQDQEAPPIAQLHVVPIPPPPAQEAPLAPIPLSDPVQEISDFIQSANGEISAPRDEGPAQVDPTQPPIQLPPSAIQELPAHGEIVAPPAEPPAAVDPTQPPIQPAVQLQAIALTHGEIAAPPQEVPKPPGKIAAPPEEAVSEDGQKAQDAPEAHVQTARAVPDDSETTGVETARLLGISPQISLETSGVNTAILLSEKETSDAGKSKSKKSEENK